MSPSIPPFPQDRPRRFRSTVHGTVFAGRDRHLEELHPGDSVRLIPGPSLELPLDVWVHLDSGDPLGHLPPEIGAWLGPWLHQGGTAEARALQVKGDDAPSWRRLVLEVRCE